MGNSNPSEEDLCDMKEQSFGFGPHLMLDLNECNPEILDNLDACYRILSDLPDKIGMKKITQPYIFRYDSGIPGEEGITGVVISWIFFPANHSTWREQRTILSSSFNPNPPPYISKKGVLIFPEHPFKRPERHVI